MRSSLLFIARVPQTVVHDGKIIGYYDKAKFPADFAGPIVGVGQAWLDDSYGNIYDFPDDSYGNFNDFQFKSFHVNVFYDGKIFESCNFSFLCMYEMPKLSHITFPEVKWETISDNSPPPNVFSAGVYPDGEKLYVGKIQCSGDEVPGYVVHTEKCLHLCWNYWEHCYDKGYKILVIDEPDSFEWGTCFDGEAPSTAVPGGNTSNGELLFIGRTVSNGDVMIGKTCGQEPITLPHTRVTNTQLLGKIHCSHKCLYVPWNGKEYVY